MFHWYKTPLVYTLRQLAEYVGGQVTGDPEVSITGIQPFKTAELGDLTLASERKYYEHLERTKASCVIVPLEIKSNKKPLLHSKRPKVAFAQIMQLFLAKQSEAKGISPLAFVSESSRIAPNVTIHPFVYVGDNVVIEENVNLFPNVYIGNNCKIGKGSTLYPGVILYDEVLLGVEVTVHSGTVIGADGFGYAHDGEKQVKIPQIGRVLIGDNVEIGANSCIDKATFGETVLESGVKLDNHVHVGHNCRIGANTVIVAQVGISGGVQIGENCVFAGHSGVVDHVKVGDNVTVMMKSAVSKDVPSGSVVSGQPAINHRQHMKIEALVKRLPEFYRMWIRSKERGRRNNDEE